MTLEEKEETKDLLEVAKAEQEKGAEKPEEKEEEKQDEQKEEGKETEDDETPSLDQVRENIEKHEKELAEEREDIAFVESRLKAVQEDSKKGLTEYTLNGKSTLDMTPEEFEEAIDTTYRLVEDRNAAAKVVSEARKERKAYFEKLSKYTEAETKWLKDAESFRAKEWDRAEKELTALYPGVEKFRGEILEKAKKELNADPVLVDRVNQGVKAKFRYLMNLVKAEGIEAKLSKEEIKREQGNREKSSASKGKSSSASESRETAYTPERIKSMSLEEYRNKKDEIYAASLKAKK